MRVPSIRSRTPFTEVESRALWSYLVQNNLLEEVHKRSVWRKMEAEGVTNHSAETMRSHFRRFYAKSKNLPTTELRLKFSRRKRSEFTERDDTAMLNYLVNNNWYNTTRIYSMDLWKDMECKGITNHSADSMRSRFRRCLTSRFIEVLPSSLKEVDRQRLIDSILRPQSTHLNAGEHGDEDSFEFTIDEESPSKNPSSSSSSMLSPCPRRLCNSRPAPLSKFTTLRNRLHSTPVPDPVPTAASTSQRGRRASKTLPSEVDKPRNASGPLDSDKGQENIDSNAGPSSVCVTKGSLADDGPPTWTAEDDKQLGSCEPSVLQQLVERFGIQGFLHRVIHLASSPA
ncbi:unnamed protein product [Calicophoron daubneyi]|uniref:Telomeric repeat-binding factor 2-interacting protein 1 n=1 Tax=Calicophoron daubneyi TaxID=300641 RepID=A0AAV2TA09_CALDB